MNKDEIIALIDSAIAGQDSAVDIGGALPKVLKGVIELIASTADGAPKVHRRCTRLKTSRRWKTLRPSPRIF